MYRGARGMVLGRERKPVAVPPSRVSFLALLEHPGDAA
jgi:hypothetical protein